MTDDRSMPASASRPLARGILIAMHMALGYVSAGTIIFADGSSWGPLKKC